jgi:hypothetical protein
MGKSLKPELKVGQRWRWDEISHLVGEITKVQSQMSADIVVIHLLKNDPGFYNLKHQFLLMSDNPKWTYLPGQEKANA